MKYLEENHNRDEGKFLSAVGYLLDVLLREYDCPKCPGWSGKWHTGVDDIEFMFTDETSGVFTGYGVAWSLNAHPTEFDLPTRMELSFDPHSGEFVDSWIEIGAPRFNSGTLKPYRREKICDAVRLHAMSSNSKLQIVWHYRFSYESDAWSLADLT